MHRTSPLSPSLIVVLLLSLATLAVYGQAVTHEFLNYDDYSYVVHNETVNAGWTREGLLWAFTTTVQGHWHPLAWLSHMTDAQLFGLNPGGHHLSSVVLHLANTLLLFAVLRRMTGAVWRSGFVAALFALHPMHVETVAWISDRKDVLAGTFWILTLWTYTRYAESPGAVRYALVLLTFSLGLMSKSFVVTLPAVLLLLDAWPLGRLRWETLAGVVERGRTGAERLRALLPTLRLVAEKLPLLALGFVAGRLALSSMLESYGETDEAGGLGLRPGAYEHAPILYAVYLGKTLWPHPLALPYPKLDPSTAEILLCSGLVLALTAGAVLSLRRRPYLVTGWFWFLGTLVPVVGLLRSGPHHLADRYTYLPLVGLFIVLVWGLAELAERWRWRPERTVALGAAALVAYGVVAALQLGLWQNSMKLFEHTLRVTEDNHVAHNNLGVHLVLTDRVEEAGPHFAEVVRLEPSLPRPHYNLANYLYMKGELEQAIHHYGLAAELKPDYLGAHRRLAAVLREVGRREEAVEHHRTEVALDPSADTHYKLGRVLYELGRADEARSQWRLALERDPAHPPTLAVLARLGAN